VSWLVALKGQLVCDIDRIDSAFYDRLYARFDGADIFQRPTEITMLLMFTLARGFNLGPLVHAADIEEGAD
jgi:hypothetical protein